MPSVDDLLHQAALDRTQSYRDRQNTRKRQRDELARARRRGLRLRLAQRLRRARKDS